MTSPELIAVSTFWTMADAQIAKGILDEAGIESMIRSDNAGGMYPAIAGAELLVRAEDVEKATDALHQRLATDSAQRNPDDPAAE
jgi:Putative prokaryotic signal transducing protein